jgi:hypothetical protein
VTCFGDENGGYLNASYSLGDKSRAAITKCEQKYDSFRGGPRWQELKRNLDDYEKCMTEARTLWASGNSAKYNECTEISKR